MDPALTYLIAVLSGALVGLLLTVFGGGGGRSRPAIRMSP